jgi:hypothetical protein
MSFATPLALALGALALPIVSLYLLKVRRRRLQVPYLRLWEGLLVETRARSRVQRLKRRLALRLQILILAGLVLALARPAFELTSVKKESIVLLLDTSASMHTLEGEERDQLRFERMLVRAREIVDARSYEDEMLVAAVSDTVDVLSPFSRNTIRLRASLEGATVTKRSLDAAKAFEFACQVTSDREHPEILFLSDGGAGEVLRVIEGDDRARLVPVGEATSNVGIVRFAARKNTSLGTDYVLAVFRNFGDEELEVRYELAVKEPDTVLRTVKVVDVTLAPGEEVTETWEYSFDSGATLRLQVSSEDDRLELDDEAWAVVRPTRLRKVVLIAPDLATAAPYKIAFTSMAEVISADTFATTTAAYSNLSAEERRADVTIVIDELPATLPERGNLILMNTPLPDYVPARLGEINPAPVVWDWDREHLLNRYLNYRDLPLPPARTVVMRGGSQGAGEVLVETFDGPLIAAFDLAERRVVYVAFDMLAEYFPFRLAFPMLLRNSIAWFEVEEDVLIESSYAPGDLIRPLRRVSADKAHISFVNDAERVTRTVDVREGHFLFGETDETGPYIVQIGGVPYPTTVNLFDPGESAIMPDDPGDEGATGDEEGHLFNRDIWTFLAALALILWTVEWFTYHRRWTE